MRKPWPLFFIVIPVSGPDVKEPEAPQLGELDRGVPTETEAASRLRIL